MEKILYLTLKKQWFDLIHSGIKTEEYREIKPYWIKRLTKTSIGFHPSDYTHVHFRLGYAKEAPTMKFEISGFTIGCGNPDWGGTNKDVFIIKLGKRIY